MEKTKTKKLLAGAFFLMGGLPLFLFYLASHCNMVHWNPELISNWERSLIEGLWQIAIDLYKFIYYFEGGLLLGIFLAAIFLVLAIGLFAGKRKLIAGGSAAGTVVSLLSAIGVFYVLHWAQHPRISLPEAGDSFLKLIKNVPCYIVFLSSGLLFAMFFVLLFIATRNRKRAKLLCHAAAGLILLRIIPVGFGATITAVKYTVSGCHPSACSVVIHTLFALGAFFAGEALADMASEKEEKEKTLGPVKGTGTSGDSLDALVTLKQLLDSGAITQEEFDAKKKQLLGL